MHPNLNATLYFPPPAPGGVKMKSFPVLLLLCSLRQVVCGRSPQEQHTIKKRETQRLRLPKADDGLKHSVIDISDDNDSEPDKNGEYTMASLKKPNMPRDFTACTAFMVTGWTTPFTETVLFFLWSEKN